MTANYAGSFNITGERRYALVVTLDDVNNLVLLQVDEGSVTSTEAQKLLTSSQAIIFAERNDLSAPFTRVLAGAILQ